MKKEIKSEETEVTEPVEETEEVTEEPEAVEEQSTDSPFARRAPDGALVIN